MILNAFQAVLMVLVLIAVGYLVARLNWANDNVQAFLPKFITNVTLPATVVSNIAGSLSRDDLPQAASYLLAAVIAMGIAFALGYVVAKAARIDKARHGVFSVIFSLSNAGFMGLPVAMAIFGDEGMIFAIFYFVANAAFMNSIGYLGIERDGSLMAGGSAKRKKGGIFKQVLTPPLIAVVLSFVLVLLDATTDKWPEFLSSSVGMLGNVTSPLALVFVGMALHSAGLSCIKRIDKPLSIALMGRFIISPLIMWLVALLFGFSPYATGVLVVQTGLPAMVATTIFAKSSGADMDLAARGVVVSTLLSFISIPVYIAILGM